MKVTQSSNQNLQQIYQSSLERTGQSNQTSQPSHSRPSEQNDSVEVSYQAQLLQKAVQEVERDEPARLQRIAKLREQVQDDSYQVPVQQLAARLLNPGF
jgi:negative regulator of flagellin synthesis FlgM